MHKEEERRRHSVFPICLNGELKGMKGRKIGRIGLFEKCKTGLQTNFALRFRKLLILNLRPRYCELTFCVNRKQGQVGCFLNFSVGQNTLPDSDFVHSTRKPV